MRRGRLAAGLLVLALALAGCGGGSGAAPSNSSASSQPAKATGASSQAVQARCAQAVTESNEVGVALLAWENDPNQKLSGLISVADIADRAAVVDASLKDDRLLAYSIVMVGLSSALHINAMGGTDPSGVGHGLRALQTLKTVLQDCANGGTMTLPPSLDESAAP